MTFTTFTSALLSKASAFSASIESSCLRLGSLVAVFRALEWMIRLAHEELSPTTGGGGLGLVDAHEDRVRRDSREAWVVWDRAPQLYGQEPGLAGAARRAHRAMECSNGTGGKSGY